MIKAFGFTFCRLWLVGWTLRLYAVGQRAAIEAVADRACGIEADGFGAGLNDAATVLASMAAKPN